MYGSPLHLKPQFPRTNGVTKPIEHVVVFDIIIRLFLYFNFIFLGLSSRPIWKRCVAELTQFSQTVGKWLYGMPFSSQNCLRKVRGLYTIVSHE